MRGLLLARGVRGDTFSTQRRFGNRFAVWLRRLRFHLMMEKGRQNIANMSLISRQQQDLPHTVTTKTNAPSLPDAAPEAEWPARKCVRTARVVTGTACSHRAREEEGRKGRRTKEFDNNGGGCIGGGGPEFPLPPTIKREGGRKEKTRSRKCVNE